MFAFFFCCLGFARGTSLPDAGDAVRGVALLLACCCAGEGFGAASFGGRCLRMLKLEMNSKDCGESPSIFLRCSAATSLGRVSVYVMICFKLSSSKGSSCCSRGTAHDSREADMLSCVKRFHRVFRGVCIIVQQRESDKEDRPYIYIARSQAKLTSS